MPKKMGVNSKAEEARSRKAEADSERKQRETRDKEERYWQEMEGPKSKSSKKREEEAEKKAEALAKKAEARRLAEKEERDMESYGKKVDKKTLRVGIGNAGAAAAKVTAVELERQREVEAARLAALAAQTKRREMRATDEEEYEKMVAVENVNRADDLVEARTVEEAIAQMTVDEEAPVDRHPEKRAKASYKAFEEVELPRLKAEKPGLTHTQYKDMLWKVWKKSPDNPLNQAG